jgi:hypothetical protein
MEPFLDKAIDFSCQMDITNSGDVNILSVQKMANTNFNYSGSSCADQCMYDFLENKNYFTIMNSVAQSLYSDGYFGNVCVDSMILSDNSVVPIVEINARKSMGFLNHSINNYFQRYKLNSHLRFFSVGINNSFVYEELLKNMSAEKILFKADGKPGIIPLSSNALTINRDAHFKNQEVEKIFKGRLYISVGAKTTEEVDELTLRLRMLLQKMNVVFYN